ncbi:MAG: excinuclease ABC subunit UvrB, partial [Paludibacteraceae bacterium]|nr:excinuclease ABC subunit UvrB [Paludibacteraceae bacterium]
AYIPQSDTYIEKDLAINDEIDRLRLSATAALLSGRKDVVIVSSVSCLYGIGNPDDFTQNCITLKVGQRYSRQDLMHQLVNAQYVRNDIELNRGNFRVKGETIDICISYAHYIVRIVFWDDEIDVIETLDLVNNHTLQRFDEFKIYPANIFTTTKERVNAAIDQIALDLGREVQGFIERGQPYEAKRLEERVNYDLEMIKEVGYCSGVENYSRYFDNRPPGSRPFCLLDYFPDDFLLIIDESHVTVPQIRAMYGGDASRKKNLVQYGFRLEAALDNRPLKFEEFEALVNRAIYVSATPADYELQKSEGVIVEQVIRPTGLLDPIIEVRPTLNQIDDLMEEIVLRVEKDERVLVTTLRKDSAEKLNLYLERNGVRCNYIHSGVDTLDRVKILDELRAGMFDVLIGVNLLREGLDLPQVSLVAILDADKEGFLRSHRSLTQTVGRAARHLNGKAILYADTITKSMRLTIDETMRRREKQLKYNADNNITPQAVASRTVVSPLPTKGESEVSVRPATPKGYAINSVEPSTPVSIAADPVVQYMTCQDIEKSIKNARRRMEEAAKRLDFMEAAQWRDEMLQLEDLLEEKKEKKEN